MDGSVPDLRAQLTALLDRAISLAQFQRWLAEAEGPIELFGSDDDVDLMWLVQNRFAEYTGEHIDAEQLLEALAEDVGYQRAPVGAGVAPERAASA